MNPLKRHLESQATDQYFLIDPCQLSSDTCNPPINDRIVELFKRNRDNPIAHPEEQIYREIEVSLQDNSLIFPSSLSLIQKIAETLKDQNVHGIKKRCRETNTDQSSELKLSTILQRFSSLKLPQDIEEIRSFSFPGIQAHLMAAIINRDNLCLYQLDLTKDEIKKIGPALTYLDCKGVFDQFWTTDEVHSFLDTCTKVETLKISSRKITKLPFLPHCKKLHCIKCSKLEQLPPLPQCVELKCDGCLKLKELPELPMCKVVFCSNTGLTHIPPLPQCVELDCYNCSDLRTLERLNLCKQLKCNDCTNLEMLPPLDHCIKLDCSRTPLNHLPPLPLCKELNCCGCNNLKVIRDLSQCIELDCSECTNLSNLPFLPCCKVFNCNECTSLFELPNLPVCKTLYCFECINLRYLPPLPLCKKLYCIGCRNLRELPALPCCEVLNCNNCSALNLNSVPRRLREQAIQITLRVNWKDLEDDPLTILLSLEDPLIEQQVIPRIQFIEPDGRESQGVDQGGVFRIFVARLMQSLISYSGELKQLKFHKTESGLYLPILDHTLSALDINVQIKAFQVLGAVFELCYRSALSQQSVTIGRCFDRKLFDIISSLSFEELNHFDVDAKEIPRKIKLKLMTLFSETYLQKILLLLEISPLQLTFEQFMLLKNFVVPGLEEEEKGPDGLFNEEPSQKEIQELVPWLQASAKEILLRQISDDEWLPAVLITKQMHKLTQSYEELNHLSLEAASAIETKIQGVMDKALFVAAFEWETQNGNLNPKKIERTKEYVTKWINEASFESLEQLSNFITGSPTLHPSKKLTCQLYETSSNYLPSTHTCSFAIDFSLNYETYEKFKSKLELALATVNSLKSSGLEIR